MKFLILLLLMSCSDEELLDSHDTQITAATVETIPEDKQEIRVLLSKEELPLCKANNKGHTYFVIDEDIFKTCVEDKENKESKWVDIDLRGKTGDKGEIGMAGKDGLPGESITGSTGIAGSQGISGLNGISGWERVQSAGTPLVGATLTNYSVTCPIGKKVFGGGCYVASEENFAFAVNSSYPNTDSSWFCQSRNPTGSTWVTVYAYAICGNVQ